MMENPHVLHKKSDGFAWFPREFAFRADFFAGRKLRTFMLHTVEKWAKNCG